jgi:putative ABC transport system ATP-binding protein
VTVEPPAPLVLLEGVAKLRPGRDRSFRLEVPRLSLRPGQALALVGPSGCGKSTLIDLLALALAPDAAERFQLRPGGGERWFDVGAAWRARRSKLAPVRAETCGYILQTGGLLPFLDVAGNIALPAEIAGRAAREAVQALAERLGIAPLLHEQPQRLSVGQRQRVAIARALAHAPPLVLADEPTAALDPANAETVMRLLLETVAQQGAALVLATHDRALAERFGLPLGGFGLTADERQTVATFEEPQP